jgi:thiamine kinase-like enzyme
MAEPDQDALRRQLARVIGAGPVGEIELISAKRAAACYRVTVADRDVFCKDVARDAVGLLSIEAQFALLRQIGAAGIAPQAIACSAADGLLVTEYLADYRPLTADDLAEPAVLAAVTEPLRRLHRHSAGLPMLDLEGALAVYFEALGGVAALTLEDGALANEAIDLIEFVRHRFTGSATLHNDLVPANLMRGKDIRLIDFEYAASGPPVMDLAGLAEFSRLDAAAAAVLLAAYFDAEGLPFSLPDFAKVRRLTALVSHFWARAENGNTIGGLY